MEQFTIERRLMARVCYVRQSRINPTKCNLVAGFQFTGTLLVLFWIIIIIIISFSMTLSYRYRVKIANHF